MQAKLGQILEVFNDLKLIVGSLKKALTSTQAHVEEIDGKLSKRCKVIKQNLGNKTKIAKFIYLKHQQEILQQEKAADRKLIENRPQMIEEDRKQTLSALCRNFSNFSIKSNKL